MNAWNRADQFSIKFLVPGKSAGYDLDKPPGNKNTGGGTGVKYARIESMNGYHLCRRASAVDEVEPDDVVFADWLWFYDGDKIDQIKSFLDLPNVKGIYGGELSMLAWEHSLLRQLVDGVDVVTHNTEYQRRLYGIHGIYNSRFLCDPVPESVFKSVYPQVKRRLVCGSQISESKRSDAVAEIFTFLKGSEVETCYVGGSGVWGGYNSTKRDLELAAQIRGVADIFVENATQSELAVILSESSYYAHVSLHDCSSINYQENGASGNVCFGLSHPVSRERTDYRFDTPELLAKAVVDYPFGTDQHENDVNKILAIAQAWSYESWEDQMNHILRFIT